VEYSSVFYWAMQTLGRVVFFCTQRQRLEGFDNVTTCGPFLLASTHRGHLDPYAISVILPRRIRWMARAEFYKGKLSRRFMDLSGCLSVNRKGPVIKPIRRALRLLASGEIVGLFPEGEVVKGRNSVLNGATLKRGVCLLARRSGAPVIPCVVLGTEHLNRMGPWLPARRGYIQMACGKPLVAPHEGRARDLDRAFALRLESAFRELSANLGGLEREDE